MHRNRAQHCDHHIVSIHQPYSTLLYVAKPARKLNLDPKVGISLTGHRLAYINYLDWNSYLRRL